MDSQHLSAGSCPWCGATKAIRIREVTLTHPPQACCPTRAIWNLSWLAYHSQNPEYAEDIRSIKIKLRQMLSREENPTQVLEDAKRNALAHQGHGNVYAVVQALAAQIRGAQ